MKFFNRVYRFDFMRMRRFWLGFSALSTAVSLVAMLTVGFRFGVDFTGGTLVELAYPQPVPTEAAREALAGAGFARATAQHFGTSREMLVRLPPLEGLSSAAVSERLVEALRAAGYPAEVRRVEFVGPQVGAELAEDGALAFLGAMLSILVYVMLRFESKLALAAVIATLHDTVLTAGFFLLTPWEFDLTVLAAIMTVAGYSINDTIVVFDRIRENFRRMRTAPALEVVNASINETLSRTLMTGTTTAMVLLALWFFGGELNAPFAVTVLLGLLIGTYSSIYVASPVAVALGVDRKTLLPVPKEGLGANDGP